MFKNRSCGQWFKWIFLNREAFSSGSRQEITRGFIVFLLSHLGRFTPLVRMETMLHLHHTHHRSFILRTGSRTPELTRTITKVKTCTLLVWAQVDDHHCKITSLFLQVDMPLLESTMLWSRSASGTTVETWLWACSPERQLVWLLALSSLSFSVLCDLNQNV